MKNQKFFLEAKAGQPSGQPYSPTRRRWNLLLFVVLQHLLHRYRNSCLGPRFALSREAAGRKAPEEKKGGFAEEAEGSLSRR